MRYIGSRLYAVVPLFSAYLFVCYIAALTPIFIVRQHAVVIYSMMAIILLLVESAVSPQEKKTGEELEVICTDDR